MNVKSFTYLSVLICAICLCACTGKKTEQQSESVDSIIRCELPDSIVEQLDTLGSVICQMTENDDLQKIISTGSVNLTEVQKQARPDFLITKEDIDDLLTINQKYAAMAQMIVDRKLTEIYHMDEEDDYYNNEMERLSAEVGLSTEKAKPEILSVANINDFYHQLKQDDRLDIFYSAAAAYLVETLYIVSRDQATFMPGVSDETAQRISRGIEIVSNGAQAMAESNELYKPLAEALQPLTAIKATTAAELQAQIGALTTELETARKAVLK